MRSTIFLLAIITCASCKNSSPEKSTNSINGLWVVKEVKVGEDIMTPNARWTKLHSDSTQVSGNGWKQHSIGHWQFNEVDSTLRVVSTNGTEDEDGDYEVSLNRSSMKWEREEGGMTVRKELSKSSELPMTYADRMLGLWELDSNEGDSFFLNEVGAKLFIRWDGRFVIYTSQGQINGVYNVHGHRSEIELIPYGEELDRSFWSVDLAEEEITMKLLNSDSIVTRNFHRVRTF